MLITLGILGTCSPFCRKLHGGKFDVVVCGFIFLENAAVGVEKGGRSAPAVVAVLFGSGGEMNAISPCEVGTYFSHAERMFPEIHNDKVPTEQFLKACQGIADFVGFLGTAFIPVKNDISGNVIKVRTKYESDKDKCKYVEDLIDDDLAKNGGKMGVATEGLLWLKRGLEFMLELLSEMVRVYRSSSDKSKTDSLAGTINNAYNSTLKRHHGFVSKQLFKVVILAAPTRSTILKALAEGREGVDDICIDHIAAHLDNFRTNVAHIVDYYIKKNLDTPNPSAKAGNPN